MLMEDAVFYLGEKKETGPEGGEAAEKKDFRIAYGGDMPAFLENPEYRPLTEAEVEKKRILMDKHGRRSMIVRRLLYLEKRRTEIVGYMSSTERLKKRERAVGRIKIILFLILTLFVILFLYLATSANECLMVGIPLGIGLIVYAILRRRARQHTEYWREAEWEMSLNEMEAEHEELMKEKEQLTKEIKELENV